jgi:hypothetical protein
VTLQSTASASRGRRLGFAAAATVIGLACTAVLRSRLHALNPDMASWGATFDLIITIPLIYYVFLVRPRLVRPVSIIPLFVVCMTVARLLVPRPEQQFLRSLGLISAPLEIVTIWLLLARTRRASRRLSGEADAEWVDRLRAAAQELTGSTVLAEMVAGEIAVWYYALFAWGKRPRVKDDEIAITVHQQGGWGAVLVALMIVISGESLAVHVVVQHWSTKIAWIVTALEVYGILWLIADFRALDLRPTLVGRDSLRIRVGLRWTAAVPFRSIASVARITPAPDQTWRRRGLLKAAVLSEPQYLLRLSEPVTAHAIYGIRREVSEIAIAPDDREAFEAAFSAWLEKPGKMAS